MTQQRFWDLQMEDWAYIDLVNVESVEWVPCPHAPKDHTIEADPRNRVSPKRELLHIAITSKRKAEADFLQAGIYTLISDRVLQMFEEEHFTGFVVRPTIVKMKVRPPKNVCETDGCKTQEKKPAPVFWELINIGWGGLAPRASGVRLSKRCRGCNRQQYTAFTHPEYLVDEKQWDGSDILLIWPMPVHIIVTDRVAQFILEKKLTGVKPVPVAELEWPEHVIRGFSPGSLRQWLPESRAREVGEPLGIY